MLEKWTDCSEEYEKSEELKILFKVDRTHISRPIRFEYVAPVAIKIK